MAMPQVGLALLEGRDDVTGTIEAIKRAEALGVPMIWTTLGPRTPDAPTLLAAAAFATDRIGLGTAIVPTYPRHPAVIASQLLVLTRLAPERLRLGLGGSHRSIVEEMFGLPMGRPLEHLREYVTVLRALLWEGAVDFSGRYYAVHLALDRPAPVPIYLSALGERAFELAGRIADGVVTWLCPVPYLRDHALPSLRRAAARANRPPPRLVVHVPVVLTEDVATMRRAARSTFSLYGRLPFYASMFARAGYPVGADGVLTDGLLDELIVWGSDKRIESRLIGILSSGIDELMLSLISLHDRIDEEARLARIMVTVNQPRPPWGVAA